MRPAVTGYLAIARGARLHKSSLQPSQGALKPSFRVRGELLCEVSFRTLKLGKCFDVQSNLLSVLKREISPLQEMTSTCCLRDGAGWMRGGSGLVGRGRCLSRVPLPSSTVMPFGRRCVPRKAGAPVAESMVRRRSTRDRTVTRSIGHQIRRG